MKKRHILDIIMALLSMLLMGGIFIFPHEIVHEILGVALFLSWAIHVCLNYKFYLSMFKGKYNAHRIIMTFVDVIILLCALLLMISGIMLSNYVFVFLNIENGVWLARSVHLIVSHWYYAFMIFHVALHTANLYKKVYAKKIFFIPLCAIGLYGIFAFIRRKLYLYMFNLQPFFMYDETGGIAFFIFEYLSMIIAAGLLVFGYRLLFKKIK